MHFISASIVTLGIVLNEPFLIKQLLVHTTQFLITRFVVLSCLTVCWGWAYPSVIFYVSTRSIAITCEGYLEQKLKFCHSVIKGRYLLPFLPSAHRKSLFKVIYEHKSGWCFKWFVIKISRINDIFHSHVLWITFSNSLEGKNRSFCYVIESSHPIIS